MIPKYYLPCIKTVKELLISDFNDLAVWKLICNINSKQLKELEVDCKSEQLKIFNQGRRRWLGNLRKLDQLRLGLLDFKK